MVVKRIGSGGARNAVDTTRYISDGKHAGDNLDADRPEELAGHGPKVVAAGVMNTEADGWHEAAREIVDLESLYKGKGHSTDHLVLSWQADERPTKQQMAEAVAVALRHAGYADQPAVWTAHGDTQNLHIHIAVSRIALDAAGQAKIIDGAATVRSKHGDNIVESLHVGAAEIIARQGWKPEPDARYGPDLKRTKKQRDPNALNFSQKIKDFEALTGKEHPSHTLALVAVPILRQAKSWPEAKETLATQGIEIQIKSLKNGTQGAVLSTPLGARVKLSSLPQDCSLKNLNKKFSVLGPSLADSKPGPQPSAQAAIKLAEVTAKRKAQPKRVWTPAQVKNQAKRILSDSVSWGDALRDFKREGWTLERAGKSGALLVVKTGDTARPEIRVKMSDIPGRGNSYGKLSERFGNTAEEALQNGDVSKADFDAVVSYPERAQNSVTQAVTNQGIQDDPNAIRLPASVTDDERLTGQASPLRRMALAAVDTIRTSQAKSINGLASDLAAKGIEMKPSIQNGQMYGIRLSSPGVQGSISLAALPRDCRLSSLAQRFSETYRHRPDRYRPNSRPDGKPIGTLVQINPEDDALEILRKTLEAIAQDLAAGGQPATWDRDTRPITLVRPRPADLDAALDHRVPTDLPREQAQTWKVQEQIKGIFRGTLEKINAQKAENPDAAGLGWKLVGEELDRRGWRLEMVERDLQIVDQGGEAFRLADLEINTLSLVRAWGEPENAPLVPLEGENPEQTATRRGQIVYDRHMRIEAGDAARLLREPLDVESLLARVEARGWRLEDTIQSVRVVLDEKTAVDVGRLKIDALDIFDRLNGRRLPVAGWKDMDAEQRRSAIERIELREALRAKTWEAVLDRLERRGARIELTGGGQGKAATGGRVALADGRKIPLSAMGGGLAQLKKRKTGSLDELVKTREQARKGKASPAPAPGPAPTPKTSQKAQDEAKNATEAVKRAEIAKILKEIQDREKQENALKRQDADARAAKSRAIKQAPTPQAAQAAQATKLKTDQNQQLKAQEQARAKARTQDQQTQARTQEQREKEEKEKRERERERFAREAMDKIRSNDAFKPIRSNASSEVDNLTKMLHENSAQEQRNTLERLQHEARQQQLQQEGMKHG